MVTNDWSTSWRHAWHQGPRSNALLMVPAEEWSVEVLILLVLADPAMPNFAAGRRQTCKR